MSKLRSVVDRVIAAGALAVVILAPTQFSIEVMPNTHLSPVDPVVWLVFLLWLLRSLLTDARQLLRTPLPTILFLLACGASCIRAADRMAAYKDIFQFAEYFVAAYLVLSTEVRAPRARRVLTDGFLAATTVILAIASWQYVSRSVTDFDVRGTFGNCNVLGGYLCLAVPLALGLLLEERKLWRQAWLLLILALSAGIVLSGGALIGILLGCTLVGALRGRVRLAVVCAGVVIICAAVLPHLPRGNQDVLYQSVACFGDDGELNPRYPEWQAAAVMAMENPLTGVGIGNYQANIGTYYGVIPSPNIAAEPDSQNLYLVLASSAGFPGAVCLAAMLLWFIVLAVRHADTGGRGAALGAAGGLLAFAVGAVWSPLLVRGIGLPLAFLMALAAAAESETQREPEKTTERS